MKAIERIYITSAVISILFFAAVNSAGQDRPEREFVTDQSKVSFVKTTPFNVAMKALSDIAIRLERKVIIDPLKRSIEIGIDIDNLQWRSALELITKVNGLTIMESENYIQIGSTGVTAILAAEGEDRAADQPEFDLKPVTRNLREIKISATFLEADRKKLREIGFNWGIFQQDGNTSMSGDQLAAGARSDKDAGVFEITHIDNNTEFNAMLKALESNDVGEVVANPNVVVADGRTGRVQIGQDFSIKQRDFAGNVTDKFVSTGIILLVTPTIVVDDTMSFIHLVVQAERSSALPGAISTIINKTQANTEMLINDGEKVGIGGLFMTEETVNRNGLPVLKNIPKWFLGLGYLFGHESINKTEKELIILLKAEIIPTLSERLITMQQKGNEDR